jgi:serine/threonine-protein kinase
MSTAVSGTVFRDRSRPDGRMALVTLLSGVRLLDAVPAGTPLVAVPAVREADNAPVRVLVVTASLDPATRRRIRAECAALEAALADVDPAVVLPVLDHGVDATDRPYLLMPRPGPVLDGADGPTPVAEVVATARAITAGLAELASRGVGGPPPPAYRTPTGPVLGTPLPPVLVELRATLGTGTGHEPPEVLSGGDWTPAGQIYACASILWALLSGRPPFGDGLDRLLGTVPRMERADVPGALVGVLRQALSLDPADRPESGGTFAEAVAAASTPVALDTLPPTRPTPLRPEDAGARPLGSRYLLDQRIGGGATGQVWAGRRREDGSPVAVKLIRGDLAENPEVVARFLRERATLVRLQHPHLVRVHDLVAEGEVLGIVMDLVNGPDLRRLVAGHRLSQTEAAGLLAQTASALAAVHAAGVVHRDVKPENVLVTERDGRRMALLTDFGTARATDDPTLTRDSQLIGTPAYLAPERVRGYTADAAADVYALGVIAYELFAGHRPFPETSTEAVQRAHLDTEATRPAGLDDDAWDLVSACLDKQPDRRPSAAEAANRFAALAGPGALVDVPPPAPLPATAPPPAPVSEPLEPLATQLSARPLPARPAEPVPRRRRGRWLLLGTIGAVTVLGLAVGTYLGHSALGHSAPPAHSATPSPSSDPALYPVPVVLSLDRANSLLISWDLAAAQLPGFRGFYVLQMSPDFHALAEDLPGGTSSYRVDGLVPAQRTCYMVYAYGVTAAVPDPPPPACVAAGATPASATPPTASRPPPARSGTPTPRPRSTGASSPSPGCPIPSQLLRGHPCPARPSPPPSPTP